MKNILNTIKKKGKKAGLKAGALVLAGSTLVGGATGCATPGYYLKPSFLLTESEKDDIARYRKENNTEQTYVPRETYKPREMTLEERYNSGREDLFFNCKAFVDENNDNIAQFNEFKGISNYFRENEKFLSVAVIKNKEGRVELMIMNPKGNYVKNSGEILVWSKMLGLDDLLTFKTSIYFDENDTSGEYTERYFLQGKEIGRNSLTIGK